MKKLEIKFKSIAFRWLVNIYLLIVALVVLVSIIVSVIYVSLCVERVRSLGDDYAYEFSALKTATSDTFEDMAVTLTDSFQHKTKIEVQVIDTEGIILVSTTAFQPQGEPMVDYQNAITSSKGIATYRGKNSGGEAIYACTTVVKDNEGEILGAYRWVSSMERMNKQILFFILLVILIDLAVLGISAISGLYFIKSIVRPIRDVGNIARKMAMGDFESRIEIKNNDEIGELCDAINYMASELSQAETMKNDFISSVSHELRTPLTAIRGWGETAKMSVGSDETLVNRGLEVVLSEADRLSNLVEELLDFSRMQSGRLTVNTLPIDVSVLLTATANMYTELARQQGIELSYTPSGESAIVMGDPDRLKQVFVNIIDNAVKYTQKGGLVLVTQGIEEGCVRILVKDTGVGIPAQDIDKVKEKFFKSNKTIRGSGIGLAVADEIIKQHQGLLFLESTEGVGTTVTIVLPLFEEENPIEEETINLEELTLSLESAAEEIEEVNEASEE
ncbi:MAG: HAMP domain-containing histidine kinase [Clostridia bacterium]|nr:HAMP domain-containing histidine kinase [Clostridia bacterium]